MYFVKTPFPFKYGFKNLIWNISTKEKVLYLTFDDGPHPDTTPYVLAKLKDHEAKATFFCIGKNIQKYPEIYKGIMDEGHAVGNHTFNHLNGWKTKTDEYLNNVKECAEYVSSNLFRPPYGKITPKQYLLLNNLYSIVMWDVLSGDFDTRTTRDDCLKNITNNAKQGSIVVLHDSIKAKEKMMYVLSKVLDYFSNRGFGFNTLNSSTIAI